MINCWNQIMSFQSVCWHGFQYMRYCYRGMGNCLLILEVCHLLWSEHLVKIHELCFIYTGMIKKVLKYFCYVWDNLSAPDVFAEGVKMTNHTGLWDAKLAWYSSCDTHRTCLYGLQHDLGIHGFRPAYPCLTVEVLATR